jgi:hypothetical protein
MEIRMSGSEFWWHMVFESNWGCWRSKRSSRLLRATLTNAILLLTALRVTARANGAEVKNLVANGDFSQIQGGKPLQWETAGDENVTQSLEIALEKGNPCAKLVCTRCEQRTPASHAMITQTGLVNLKQGKVYELSLRARSEGLTGGSVNVAIMDTSVWTACGLHEGLDVGRSWQEFRRVFRATRTVDRTSRLQFWFTEPGTLYLDDVRFVETPVQQTEFTDVVPPTGHRNLVPNSSFEVGAAGWSSLSQKTGWGALANLHGQIVRSAGTHGQAFLRVPLGGDDTPVLHFDYYEPVVRRELQPLAANLGWIAVEPNAPYTISCDVRASEEGAPAVLGVRSQGPETAPTDHRRTVVLSTVWKRYAFTFRPAHRYVFVTVGPSLAEDKRIHVDIDAVQLEKGERATAFEPRSPFELGVEPSSPAGIFERGERACLRLRAQNHSAEPMTARIDFEVRDFFDKQVAIPSESLTVPAASGAQWEIGLSADWRGYYRLQARYKAGQVVGSQALRLAIVPRRSFNDSVLGINHAFATSYLIRLAKKAGVTWYRDWTLKWQHLEPSPGAFRWEIGDAQLGRVLREGAQVLPLLPPFPSANWSSEAPAGLPTGGYPGVRLPQAWAPKEPEKLANFVAGAAKRYGDRIRVWEFLNEPIFTDYALPGKQVGGYPGRRYTPADYVKLLEVAASGIRRADPGCRIIGGIAGPPTLMTREVIEAGCLRYVDTFNLHPYPGAARPEFYLPQMDKLLRLMDAHGGRKPIWVTEFSYWAADDLPCRPFLPNVWCWATLLDSERRCAEYTVRFFTIMLGRGAKKVFVHAGSNGSANEWNFECCLFTHGGAPRKVFPALGVLTELMGPKPVYAGERSFAQAGHCFAFETGNRAVLVLWAEKEGEDTAVAVPAAASECLDIMGRTVSTGPISLSTAPIYVVGPAGKAKELLNLLAHHSE